ncbi:hypothetical protein DEO72_LG11g861 [Vigna unguiculata]|uniref:Uncharacterized protein n=1 Tax=Vigna unguiculata TaxID=3917 RepID=A0A4D6NJ54_VIGUN|nr:hypothetical protein DEO72_LG11g861 [Vigna unguiculata]
MLVLRSYVSSIQETVAAEGRTVARPVALAQARLSRLGETCRSRPRLHSNSRSGGELLF